VAIVPLWPSTSTKIKLLERVPLFEGLSPQQLGQIAHLADEVEVAAKKRLTSEGETGRELFVIIEGTAVVRTPKGRTVTLGPGQFFGEMSLIDGGPRSATVEATTPMRLLVVGHREFWELLAKAPLISKRIMRVLSYRLREADAAFSPCC
jgi:CRP-like cAMP-binding protein